MSTEPEVKRIWLRETHEENGWKFGYYADRPQDDSFIEYVPASALAPLARALEKIADGDTECNCTHEDEFCCVVQKHYCPFCIAVVALTQDRKETHEPQR